MHTARIPFEYAYSPYAYSPLISRMHTRTTTAILPSYRGQDGFDSQRQQHVAPNTHLPANARLPGLSRDKLRDASSESALRPLRRKPGSNHCRQNPTYVFQFWSEVLQVGTKVETEGRGSDQASVQGRGLMMERGISMRCRQNDFHSTSKLEVRRAMSPKQSPDP